MIAAANKIGLLAKGVKANLEALRQVPQPLIAHVRNPDGLHHYVIVTKIKHSNIWIMDPAYGTISKNKLKDFESRWTGVLILLLPDQGFKPTLQSVSVVKRLTQLIRPYTSIMIQSMAGSIAYTILGLSGSFYLRQIVDHVLVYQNLQLLNLLSIGMILLLLIQLLLGFLRSMFMIKLAQHLDAALVLGYFKHLLQLPQRFFDTMRVGEILSRINDAVKIRMMLSEVIVGFIINACIVLFSVGLMFVMHWKLALVVALVLPFYGVVYAMSNYINRKWQRRVMEQQASLEAQLVESMSSIRTVKRLHLEELTMEKTESAFVKLMHTAYQVGVRLVALGTTSEGLTRLFTIIMLWCGSYFVIAREMSPGELLSFYALLAYFTGPAMQLISGNKQIQEAFIATDRLFEIIDLERESDDGKGIELGRQQEGGGISFSDVHFGYGSTSPVLKGLNMYIPFGTTVAIVGASGSGKSTLLSLLHKLYPLRSGTIHIGQYDIRYISRDSLRRTIGVVPQETELFADTILWNITGGDLNPDIRRVDEIVKLVGLYEHIAQLPQHYYTALEERGQNLSGGQKQRIAIARALYQQPKVMVLDEATASLDSESEWLIKQALSWYRRQGNTVILIAHNLPFVKDADRLFVLQDGAVAESGTHEELITLDGLYARMWRLR